MWIFLVSQLATAEVLIKDSLFEPTTSKADYACRKQNIGDACFIYADDMGRKGDPAEFYSALVKGCKLKSQAACKIKAQTDTEGEVILSKCESGDADSCVTYAVGQTRMYRNPPKSKTYFQKACDLGKESACAMAKK